MTGLLALVKQLSRASTSIEVMLMEQSLECPQAIIRDEAELVVMTTQTAQNGHTNSPRRDPRARVNCFHCGWIGHIAKDCTNRKHGCVHNFHCGGIGHIASSCPGNKPGDKMLVLLCPPPRTRCEQATMNHLSTS